ncbi:NPCBM/NEW2 domain-containing protein, partial [Streptomyces sp.]|uniref:NPCBM/NEW2 domain-containing protein n=1 Tax=Streptomyces sp. TaxID=1931 RepID=UPI002F3F77E2
PAKVGVAAAAVVAAAATAFALGLADSGGKPQSKPKAQPAAASPAVTVAPLPATTPPPPRPAPVVAKPAPQPATSKPSPRPQPKASPAAPKPKPAPEPKKPMPSPTPPRPGPTPPPATAPAPVAVAYRLNSLGVNGLGDSGEPTIRPSLSSWWWDRWGLNIADTRYEHGITVHAPSTVTIDLNLGCVTYGAKAGVDDLSRPLPVTVRFSVYGDDTPLWASGPVSGGDPAVPVHIRTAGYKTIKLVVAPERRRNGGTDNPLGLADRADSAVNCV